MALQTSLTGVQRGEQALAQEARFGAHNYHPLPIVVSHAEGVWVIDSAGKRYMDMLSAYSALNFGHCMPRLVEVAKGQLERVTLTSRAFHNELLGPMCAELAELCGMETVLPMNTGAEAVETAIKMARKWGYLKKRVAPQAANIIVCSGNFHGRTTTIISFSDDPQARAGFGPYTPGFVTVPYGDAQALRHAIDANTVGFLFEPIQGESGVIIPPAGYLRDVRSICDENNVLMLADEIQSGLGRTGKTFACQHEDIMPDAYILGKALGGGIMPISAVVSRRHVLDVFTPGDHGSTFGGNPLACAITREVIAILREGNLQSRAHELGQHLLGRLQDMQKNELPEVIEEVRGRGLWFGIQLTRKAGKARPYCEALMREGLLCKDTHEHTIRLAPPLVIKREEVDWALQKLLKVFQSQPAA